MELMTIIIVLLIFYPIGICAGLFAGYRYGKLVERMAWNRKFAQLGILPTKPDTEGRSKLLTSDA